MSNREKHIDDFFKDELDDYIETPPPAAWDALEKKLDTRKPIGQRLPKRWFWYFAAASLMVSLGVSFNRYVSNRQADTDQFIAASNTNNSTTTGNNNITSSSPDNQTTVKQTEDNTTIAPTATQSNNGQNADNNEENNNGTVAAFNTQAGNKHNNTGRSIVNKKTVSTINRRGTKSRSAGRKGSNGRTSATDETELAYNAAPSGGDHAQTSPSDNGDATPPAPTPAPKLPKPDPKADTPIKKLADKEEKKDKKNKPHIQRFDLGIKAGYEAGFNNDAASKFLASPYLQYNISKKFAIMTQPAVKTAHLDTRRIGGSQTYYKVNGDGTVKIHDSSMIVIVEGSGVVDSYWIRNYTYSQTHDSIIKSNTVGGNYLEFDIPLLLKYSLSKKLSVYGGVNVTYGKLISIDEHTYTSDPIEKTAKQPTMGRYHAPAPAPVPIDQLITYKGTPISAYTGQEYPSPKGDLLRFGYMLGFSYEYGKRWMLDGMLLQNAVTPDTRAGYNINTALSAAYFRFTVGYKITKPENIK